MGRSGKKFMGSDAGTAKGGVPGHGSRSKQGSMERELDAKVAKAIDKFQSINPGAPLPDNLAAELMSKPFYFLSRHKKLHVQASIARVLDQATQAQKRDRQCLTDASDDEDEEGDEEEEDEDSEFENKGVPMMVVEDNRDMNRSLTMIWQQHMVQPSGLQAAEAVTEAAAINFDEVTPEPAANGMSSPGRRVDTALKEQSMPRESTAVTEKMQRKAKRRKLHAKGTSERKKKKAGLDESQSFVTNQPTGRIADLGGLDSCIEEILELVAMPLKHPEVFRSIGFPPPKGLLLHGPPGCGKTLLANALAGELGVSFISVPAPSVVSGMSGESEKKIREVFAEAKECAPCILFIDEIDAITPKRENAQREMERRIVAQLLTCLDDLSWEKTDYKPVILIGATNRPDSLDPALRRAGRFDREICLGVPDQTARAKILRVLASKLRVSGDFDFDMLARMTPGYVGADLQALTSAAGMNAVKRAYDAIRQMGIRKEHEAASQKRESFAVEDDGGDMQIDGDSSSLLLGTSQRSLDVSHADYAARTISCFLAARPDPLTPTELESFEVTNEDFLAALASVQPSSKREGFATVPDVTWDDIGALQHVRQELRLAVVDPIRYPRLFEQVGIKAPTGCLLWGPPGCGKTLLAKAVANETHTNFISVKGPELLNKYVGESERAVRQVFARARASAPCVVFFDEFDALCSRRDESQSEVSSRMVNTLLTELDGMENRKQVYIIAATNRPDIIDSAMLRPGRLDKLLYVELPTAPERLSILETLSRRNATPLAPDVDLGVVARDPRLEGYSGADLASLLREAAVAALRQRLYTAAGASAGGAVTDERIEVCAIHFEAAMNRIAPSVPAAEHRMYERLKAKLSGKQLGTVFPNPETGVTQR